MMQQSRHLSDLLPKVKTVNDVLQDTSPSIARMIKTEGEQDVTDALFILITELVNFYNIGKTMSEAQISQTVELIKDCYTLFKISDFTLCFKRAKMGRYGKVYDRMDGQIILEWLDMYDKERDEEVAQLRATQSQQSKQDLKEKQNLEWLLNPKILDGVKKIGAEKPKPEPKDEDKKYQKWLRQFDRLEERQGISSSISFVKRCGKVMDSTKWMAYKYHQEIKIKDYLTARKNR
jgi:hypothetical protein